MSSENIHENHRDRMRDMYLKGGFDHMAPHQVLEFILFYAIARKDTNPIAHRLIDRFGSLKGVFEADPHDLMAVDGVGKSTAAYLKMFLDVFKIYEAEKNAKFNQLINVNEIGAYLKPYFIGKKNEIVVLLCLDNNLSVISCSQISEGEKDIASISYRRITETALRLNASFVVLAHNHPAGTAIPSGPDLASTQAIQRILKELGIHLLDHIIFAGDGDFISLVESCFLDCKFKGYIKGV